MSAEEQTLKMAQKWALVQFVLALSEREAQDRAEACEANGWRMSSAHDLYDEVIDTLTGLVTGHLDPEAYLEAERQRLERDDA